MGRRLKGASLRADKRSKVAAQELVDSTAGIVETKEVATKADDELFVIDTTAVEPSKKQLNKKKKPKAKAARTPSANEEAQIDKLVQVHSPTKLQVLVESGNTRARRAKLKGSVKPSFDLWDEAPRLDGESSSTAASRTRSKSNKKPKDLDPVIGSAFCGTKPSEHVIITTRAALPAPTAKDHTVTVEVAKAGQSYNPDRVAHNRVLQEAVQVEHKRQKAEKELKAPISTGMKPETRALLLGDSDSEEEDDNEDNDSDEEVGTIEKKQKKFTRAERNKQKRVRAEQRDIDSRKRQKKIQNSVAESRGVAKQLKREEAEQIKRRAEMETLKEATKETKGEHVYQRVSEANPIYAPTYPVALSSELKQTGGSLRTIKPKGSLITDRIISLADRDMTAKKQLKKRKRVEGKRRRTKVRVRGKGHAESKDGAILG